MTINSIGGELEKLDQLYDNLLSHHHFAVGSESITLTAIYNYCKDNSDTLVIYIHSKGTFHRSDTNDKLRRFLTRGALSKNCENLPDTCNVCSSHISALPHLHTPGNMWLARCSYVKKLLPPLKFQQKMTDLRIKYHIGINRPRLGAGRWAFEHWILSHPDVRPCDVFAATAPLQGYNNMDDIEDNWVVDATMAAPRNNLEFYFVPEKRNLSSSHRLVVGWGGDLNAHVAEWLHLYDKIPGNDSWVWEYYSTPSVRRLRQREKWSWLNALALKNLRRRVGDHVPLLAT